METHDRRQDLSTAIEGPNEAQPFDEGDFESQEEDEEDEELGEITGIGDEEDAESLEGSRPAGEGQHRIRRFHHKTRSGCLRCKQKRRKCDETKPECDNCIRASEPCIYREVVLKGRRKKRRKKKGQEKDNFVFVTFGIDKEQDPDSISRPRILLTETQDTAQITPSNTHPGVELSVSAVSSVLSTQQASLGPNWQSSSATALLQGGARTADAFDLDLISFFQNVTVKSLPLHLWVVDPGKYMLFETAYQFPEIYHTLLALTSAHKRYVQNDLGRTAQEIQHYIIGLSAYRKSLSSKTDLSSVSDREWHALMIPACLSPLYLCLPPVEMPDAYFSSLFMVSKGASELMLNCGVVNPTCITFGISPGYGEPYPLENRYSNGSVRLLALEKLIPGKDIYSPEALQDHKVEGDNIINRCSLYQLALLITPLAIDPGGVDASTAATIIRMQQSWSVTTDPEFIKHVRARRVEAAIVVAHVCAAWWKVKMIANALPDFGASGLMSENPDKVWWLGNSMGDLLEEYCSRIPNEVLGSDDLAWVRLIMEEYQISRLIGESRGMPRAWAAA